MLMTIKNSNLFWSIFTMSSLGLAVVSCSQKPENLAPRTQTFAELRTIKRGVKVQLPGENQRDPYVRERLVDGESIELQPGALAWLRRDGGATLLIAGPARLRLRQQNIEIQEGKIFVDTLRSQTTELSTPQGTLHLSQVRASLEVSTQGKVKAYVLKGGIRTQEGDSANAGEELIWEGAKKVSKHPVVAWEDWTGGLATTDQVAQPAPFGIGTVGARTPGSVGKARFPLAIQKLEVHVKIDHDFVLTEVDEVFFNPSSETVEGMYSFRTPNDAVLHRFAVDRKGSLVWGRVKEKAAAAAQYQSNVYQGSTEDPALLEWDAPGVYKARLYPIEPGGVRRVVTRYAQWLTRYGPDGNRRLYVYPMAAEGAEASLPHIEELRIHVDLEKAGSQDVRIGMQGTKQGSNITVQAYDVVPHADFALELFDQGKKYMEAYRAPHQIDLDMFPMDQRAEAKKNAQGEADYLLVPVRATAVKEPAGGLDLAIVIDASAATDPESINIASATTKALLSHLGKDDRAAVWAGDTNLREVAKGSGTFRAIGPQEREAIATGLATLDRGGATDLGAVVAEAARKLDPKRRAAVVYIGDGKPTVGELATTSLKEKLQRLPRPIRLFALGIGDNANMSILKGIAQGAYAERVSDGHEAASAALRLLEQAERPVWLTAAVNLGTGIEQVFPRALGGMVSGETALVVGRIKGELPKEIKISNEHGSTSYPLVIHSLADRGELRRRWAWGRLNQLLDDPKTGRAAVVEVGVRYGIITPFTSLYVPTYNEIQQERARGGYLEEEEDKAEREESKSADNKEGGTGTRAKGEEGSMGNSHSKASNKRFGVRGGKDSPSPQQARTAAKKDAAEFGIIGLMDTGAAPTPPTSRRGPQGRGAIELEIVAKTTATAASVPVAGKPKAKSQGNMWGSEIGDSFGAGDLGLSGIGEGGGGRGEGIGLGSIGSLGHGAGKGSGSGFGSGHGRLGGSHRSPPKVRMGASSVSGRMPPEVIQRIVRQNYGKMRLCYEQGLKRNPNVGGRVSVSFVVGRDGSVNNATNAGSELPDIAVVNCILGAFRGLSFPQPEGGVVKVTMPITFINTNSDSSTPNKPSVSNSGEKNAEIFKYDRNQLSRWLPPMPIKGFAAVTHIIDLCPSSSRLPLHERMILWKERLAAAGRSAAALRNVYNSALNRCEAPTWRERGILLHYMIDFLPSISERVSLWRLMIHQKTAANVLYRGIITRLKSSQQLREFHSALGLKRADPGLVEKSLKEAKSDKDRVAVLKKLVLEWADDWQLALQLLNLYEDIGDVGSGRSLARKLRKRQDANASVLTAVGEYYLRLSSSKQGSKEDIDEAKRTFGEIVEFSPDDPVARRRLGDLLRAHGWYDEAYRHYETLAQMAPDDAMVPLLLASAAQGMGKVEQAVQWAQKANAANAPDGGNGSASTARGFMGVFLYSAQLEAEKAGKKDAKERLFARAKNLLSADRGGKGVARVFLVWEHPELHLSMWSNALGAAMPVRDTDPLLGIAQVKLPVQKGSKLIEIRLEKDDAEKAARLKAKAQLMVVFEEGTEGQKIVALPLVFEKATQTKRVFVLKASDIKEESKP
jgi:tetratricopeptide (TPR) repeat protein